MSLENLLFQLQQVIAEVVTERVKVEDIQTAVTVAAVQLQL